MFELKTFCFDTTLNHHLCQNLKLIEKKKFNHLINTLTMSEIFKGSSYFIQIEQG
jgi:hypothetical protein